MMAGIMIASRRPMWSPTNPHQPMANKTITTDLTWITIGFALQGAFAGAIYGLQPAYLTERFPTEVRGTASAFCYHFGTILGGLVPPAVTYLTVDKGMGFPQPMLYGTIIGAVVAVLALIVSPETKGMKFTSDLQVK
jgi:MFS transporter, SHS family, lactate transporter